MLKRLKRWRVVLVRRLFDPAPVELTRCWTERGAWRVVDRRRPTPDGGWYEVHDRRDIPAPSTPDVTVNVDGTVNYTWRGDD